jgi:AcrR family transcriptional regulator
MKVTGMAVKKLAKRGAEPVVENVRDRILSTARDLIYREGARAVGIDRIVAESGVAKMSLYRWFPSKDDLIVAVLHEERSRVLKAWDQNMQRHQGAPLKQLRAQFEGLMAAIQRPNYRGCPFSNAVMTFADPAHPARAVAREFKNEITSRFRELAVAINAKDPDVLAQQLSLVADGAHASGQCSGKDGPSTELITIIDALVAAQLSKR